MKTLYFLLSVLLFSIPVAGRQTTKTLPLILRGQLLNSPDKLLNIGFTDENGIGVLDTIRLDEDGRFYLKTYKIKGPQQVNIQQKRTQINGLYVAPGYDLTITGDASDFKTLFKTTVISGTGSASNRFRSMRNALIQQRVRGKDWYEMEEAELIAYAKRERKFADSVAHAAFDPYLAKNVKSAAKSSGTLKPEPHDPYLAWFRNMVLLDNQFMELYYLLTLANQKKYGYDAAQKLIRDNIDSRLLANMSKDEFLASNDYKTWVAGSEYTTYLLKLDYLRDSTLKKKPGYRLAKINQVYTGKVKDFVLHNQMYNEILFTKNFARLNTIKELFKPYIATLNNPAMKKNLSREFDKKQAELLGTAVGQPAPAFTLQSIAGSTHSLADYNGKVVFIDLWASWCTPCRVQTPHLAVLYNKYKGDDRIAFLSVAVSDDEKEWRKAVAADKPEWLQLIDKDDQVRKAYVANVIPQFIIIDKQGKIVNFNAPEPGSGKKLEDMLLAEMNKNSTR
ncbi:TlpA disulfide reductase family protein [Pedobacter sp. SYP-B3415]|uniref:TlpA family protein disulfide reductase n=1 Tax=Pedobacter sp. SYP-B3415 TaxID=2496641 RepID=UPI00101C7727|nr:TlpA disulfide reductase family protein [Pedobacter sp. SYP-B3415]